MPRLRVQIGGTLAVTGRWSNTLEFALGGTIPSVPVLQTIANSVQTRLAANAGFLNGFSSDSTAIAPKLLYYPDGSSVATLVAQGTGAAIAGLATATHPPQVCIVASLRTDSSGRSARGRMYVPYRGSNISAAGVVNATAATAVIAYANGAKDSVVAALTASGVSSAWGVYSPKQKVMRTVTAILVGSQCDTIRHRNMNRAETYTAGTVTATSFAASADDDQDLLERIAASAHAVPFQQALQDAPGFLQSVIDIIPFPDAARAAEQGADEDEAAASVAAQSIELDDQGEDQG